MTAPTPTPIRRRLRALVVALGLVALLVGCNPYTSAQQATRGHINNSRQAESRNQLPMSLAVANKAQAWAEELARCRCLKHSNLSSGMPRGWRSIAENVGRGGNGGTLKQIHNAFMRSSGHRSNVLNPRWNVVGTGVASRGNERFVVHVFAQY